MSTTDHPEPGANANANPQNPTIASPHDQQSTAPTTELPARPDPVADTSISSAQPFEQTAAANQTQLHPATGPSGESEPAPVTSPSTTTTSQTVSDNVPAVVLGQTNTPPSMDTDEPKTAPETSTEHSDDGSGKEVEEDAGPSLAITLLLTTGSRHPFTIDGKYLRKRSVNVENFDPFLMSVYTLKELIWREWRSDWETRPTSPSSIRLISFGKLLDDKSPISDSRFSKDHPNVVHMTVKPQEVVDDEDAKGAKAQYSREREASERSPGCRCVIL